VTGKLNEQTKSRFRQFVADEAHAIQQLRRFVGGELEGRLDETIGSLKLVDAFVENLTRKPNWSSSPLFVEYSKDIRLWLMVRLAYDLAACLKNRFGGEWRLVDQEGSPFFGTPVLRIRRHDISPLEIADSHLAGAVTGGLVAVAAALERELG
jgi:hypothetical protein